jgi:hypothetical protein
MNRVAGFTPVNFTPSHVGRELPLTPELLNSIHILIFDRPDQNINDQLLKFKLLITLAYE